MIRDGRYIVPDVVWTDPSGDRYAGHVVCRGSDADGDYTDVYFEDDDEPRVVRARPSQLKELR